jgi:hypothetical protein
MALRTRRTPERAAEPVDPVSPELAEAA